MYVSEKTKQDLDEYSGQPVQIDAKEVSQVINPGDGRIGKFVYLGPAPAKRYGVTLDGICLASSVEVREDGKAVGIITVENKGKAAIEIQSQELALTLLMKRKVSGRSWSASDGASFALITCQSFKIGGAMPRSHAKGVADGVPYSWTIGEDNVLPHSFTLGSNDKKQIHVQFELPDGQYDCLCGYGGGVHEERCLASNLSAFDVMDGKAKVLAIKDR